MTAAAYGNTGRPFDHVGPAVPVLREVELPCESPLALADLAARADAHEVVHLVRAGGAAALVVTTEDDYAQALEHAALVAEARALLDEAERNPGSVLRSGTPDYDAFIEKFTRSV